MSQRPFKSTCLVPMLLYHAASVKNSVFSYLCLYFPPILLWSCSHTTLNYVMPYIKRTHSLLLYMTCPYFLFLSILILFFYISVTCLLILFLPRILEVYSENLLPFFLSLKKLVHSLMLHVQYRAQISHKPKTYFLLSETKISLLFILLVNPSIMMKLTLSVPATELIS